MAERVLLATFQWGAVARWQLLVVTAWRGQGGASQLLEAALADCQAPVWLFCNPALQAFYQRLGFCAEWPLPAALLQRLSRYQQSKDLLALGRIPCQSTSYDHACSVSESPAAYAGQLTYGTVTAR